MHSFSTKLGLRNASSKTTRTKMVSKNGLNYTKINRHYSQHPSLFLNNGCNNLNLSQMGMEMTSQNYNKNNNCQSKIINDGLLESTNALLPVTLMSTNNNNDNITQMGIRVRMQEEFNVVLTKYDTLSFLSTVNCKELKETTVEFIRYKQKNKNQTSDFCFFIFFFFLHFCCCVLK